jgi:hypothetical protein
MIFEFDKNFKFVEKKNEQKKTENRKRKKVKRGKIENGPGQIPTRVCGVW